MKKQNKIIFYFLLFTIPFLFLIYIISPIIQDTFPNRVYIFGIIPFEYSGFIFALIIVIIIPIIFLLIGARKRSLI